MNIECKLIRIFKDIDFLSLSLSRQNTYAHFPIEFDAIYNRSMILTQHRLLCKFCYTDSQELCPVLTDLLYYYITNFDHQGHPISGSVYTNRFSIFSSQNIQFITEIFIVV